MKYIIGLVVLYIVYSFVRFHYVLRTADLPKIEQTSSILGAGAKLVYVAAGDSTALGEGASTKDKTYAYLVAKKLSETNQVNYQNIGVSGATTGDLLSEQLSKIIALQPDLVTISIGANDATHWASNSEVVRNYKLIKEELTTKTKAKILISNVANLNNPKLLPRFYAKLTDWKAKRINKELEALNDSRFVIVDIHAVKTALSSDLFHPSDEGYQSWAVAYISALTK